MFTKEEYRRALQSGEVLKDGSKELLQAHYLHPDHIATATQLSEELGLNGTGPVNARFGKLGKRVAQYLKKMPPTRSDESFQWWSVLATGKKEDNGFAWQLRPALIEALLELGYIEKKTRPAPLPEELSETAAVVLKEGAKKVITVNAYERNREARARCLQMHGFRCSVCRFDFEETYGEIGKGYMHVHHLVPLARIGEEYEVDGAKDLRPVCPNCHAMLHAVDPPFTIEELRQRIKTTQQS